jgi:hypothetical protein
LWKKLPALGIRAGSGSLRWRTAMTVGDLLRVGAAISRAAEFAGDVGVAGERLPVFGQAEGDVGDDEAPVRGASLPA